MNCGDRDALVNELSHVLAKFKCVPDSELYIPDDAWDMLSEVADLVHNHPNNGGCTQMRKLTPVCTHCNDTHFMPLEDKDDVMCTFCPTPCEKCRRFLGAYCEKTPCSCECHG